MTFDTLKALFLGSVAFMLSGCSSYAIIHNAEQVQHPQALSQNYAIQTVIKEKPQGEITLVLAFSGGGTRAAALAFGVLQALEDTKAPNGNPLLDEVDIISAVSGGSITAAYYGLNGKKTFTEFQSILAQDIEKELIHEVLSPTSWFKEEGRTQHAINYYHRHLFSEKTFADLHKPGSPLILINASDIANGVRFSFVQEYFDFICSDIKQVPIAQAVAASTAVPILFNPVVLKNYQPCQNGVKKKLAIATQFTKQNSELQQALAGLKQYTENYPYLHLVDGGITDNLGLRAVYEAIELSGGPQNFLKSVNKQQTKHMAVISVDASTQSIDSGINLTNKSPTTLQTVEAITDIQIHRYNAATTKLFKDSMQKWRKQLSASGDQITPYFIKVSFDQLPTEAEKHYFNQVPTSLSLEESQIDQLIETGRNLLTNNPSFKRFLNSL